MKAVLKRAALFLAAMFSILSALSVCVFADASADAQNRIDEIAALMLGKNGAESVQAWINGAMTENAGYGSEWYAIALSQSGASYDFSAYRSALKEYLSENTVASASTREKFALVLLAVGDGDEEYAKSVFDESCGAQGIMSEIFGLHLLNNMKTADEIKISGIVQTILSKQLDDGGWALSGQYGDVDVSAMTVQALTPYYTDDEVKAAVDRALGFLSVRQLEDGDYASFGVRCPESGAQVLVALSGLGIDAASDERFIKNGHTIFDGIALYRMDDGGYCHTAGGEFNQMAAQQVFYSMISYLRFLDGNGPLYVLDSVWKASSEPHPEHEPTAPSDGCEVVKDRSFPVYKIFIISGIVIAGGIVCLVLALRKKKSYKSYLIVAAVVIALVLLTVFVNVQSAKSYYDGKEPQKAAPIGTVVMSIRCDTIADELPEGMENAVILDAAEFQIEEGDTVYTVLIDAAKQYKLIVDANGSYVRSINDLGEFDYGSLSGWMYFVNGAKPDVGCAAYILSDGDVIEWKYTKDLGNDLE